MIHGAHVILYSTNSEADRAFFRDVLRYPSVDAGGGWLIFALPPAELAVHPSDRNDVHELFFMCDDIRAFIAAMAAKNVVCSGLEEQRWGSITSVTLPGGGKVGVYQPKHPEAIGLGAHASAKGTDAKAKKVKKKAPAKRKKAAPAKKRTKGGRARR